MNDKERNKIEDTVNRIYYEIAFDFFGREHLLILGAILKNIFQHSKKKREFINKIIKGSGSNPQDPDCGFIENVLERLKEKILKSIKENAPDGLIESIIENETLIETYAKIIREAVMPHYGKKHHS